MNCTDCLYYRTVCSSDGNNVNECYCELGFKSPEAGRCNNYIQIGTNKPFHSVSSCKSIKISGNVCAPVINKTEKNNDKLKEGTKYDKGKVRLELMPFEPMLLKALVYTGGAEKYEPNNWKKGMSWMRLVGALLRHGIKWVFKLGNDEESRLTHLAHMGWIIDTLMWYEIHRPEFDDRPKLSDKVKEYLINLFNHGIDEWIEEIREKKAKGEHK